MTTSTALQKFSSKSLASKNGLDLYFQQIANLPVLSREEEKALALRWYNERDREAGQKLVVSNLKFVVKVAREYTKYGFTLSELIQEGNMGLLHAVDKFDPRKDHRLITYAVWWIRAYIQSFILRSWSVVRTGTTRVQRKLFSSLQKARRQLARMSPDEPVTNKQLAEHLNVDEDELNEAMLRMKTKDLSLDQPVGKDSQRSVGESMADDKLGAEERLIQEDLNEKVRERLAEIYDDLKPRERFLLEHRLLAENPMTLEAAGKEFGVTRERVRQLEVRLKEKLKQELSETVDMPLALMAKKSNTENLSKSA